MVICRDGAYTKNAGSLLVSEGTTQEKLVSMCVDFFSFMNGKNQTIDLVDWTDKTCKKYMDLEKAIQFRDYAKECGFI